MNKTAGQIIKELREKAGLSQAEVARELGGRIIRQIVWDWEQDRSKVPISKIKSLAKLLMVEAKELLVICYPEIKEML